MVVVRVIRIFKVRSSAVGLLSLSSSEQGGVSVKECCSEGELSDLDDFSEGVAGGISKSSEDVNFVTVGVSNESVMEVLSRRLSISTPSEGQVLTIVMVRASSVVGFAIRSLMSVSNFRVLNVLQFKVLEVDIPAA